MKNFLTIIYLCCCITATAQPNIRGWHLKDYEKDGYYGISLTQAYDFLQAKNLKSSPVIVAILDDGIDTLHEDLRQVLWVNKQETPRNGIDDDHNGYIDDVHGWNFLGNQDGRNVGSNSSEWIRVYWRYKSKYEAVAVDTSVMSRENKYEYALWQKARSGVVGKGMKPAELESLQVYLANAHFCDSILQTKLNNPEFTAQQLERFNPAGKLEKEVKNFFLALFTQFKTPDITNTFVMDELTKYVIGETRIASGDKIPPEDIRKELTGDDETNINARLYGNSNIDNGSLMHGTHLAGIIGADRNNGLGIQGIADNIRIMMVRTSAEGDEYDKDIAMGIRYAVDNGAKIINMSFGKSLSPDKQFIDDAVKYALSKDVLLIHAAGNSKRNIDAFDNFPNRRYLLSDSLAPNWITVGASDTSGMAAEFSNYGRKVVDIFAPGVAIYSTIPTRNKYMSLDGTSMAAPVVSGSAALLRSYFPLLSAVEIKYILEKTAVVPGPMSIKPGTTEKVKMTQLCASGGIINLYKAVQLASEK